MSLPEHWAKPEDFAVLFQYFWHRDFPIDQNVAVGARRIDWTIHIGVIVRNIADLMGLVTRFERGGRKDALLRSTDGDEVAIEWEWEGIEGGNELRKLKLHSGWPKGKELKYAVLITYTNSKNIDDDYNTAKKYWDNENWPLLLILIESEKSKKFTVGRDFKNIEFHLIHKAKDTLLRTIPAVPWKIESSRWQERDK